MGSSRCTIYVGGVVSGVYATAAYLAACCMEIGWLVESEGLLPAPSFILAGSYFFTLVVSAVLLVGIARKKTRFLLVWLFFMGIIFLPECGLVLYMSLRYWTLSSVNGITELAFYVCRAVINVLAFVCIQTLLRRWRQEKAVMRRLEFLNIGPMFRETNGGTHYKQDSEYLNGHGSTMAYTNPLPIESELYASPKIMARSPSNLTRPHVQVPYTNGSVPTSPREIFNARAAFWNTSRSEFDAASFTDYIVNRPRPLSEIGVNRASSRSHAELPTTVFSVEGGWDRGETDHSDELGYATRSLERPRFRQQHHYNNNIRRRSRSLEDVRGTMPQMAGEVFLEKLEEQPFQYLHRPGVIYRDESDQSDTHSIRDIAL